MSYGFKMITPLPRPHAGAFRLWPHSVRVETLPVGPLDAQRRSVTTAAMLEPVEPTESHTRELRSVSSDRGLGVPHTLMIVEDDPDLRETVCSALEDEGMRCVGARNGADALSRLRAGFIPDLIMLDLMMPVMNGWAFREEQKRDPRLAEIPVLVVSAFPNLEDTLGEDCPYLRKPMDLETLIAAIRRVIGTS